MTKSISRTSGSRLWRSEKLRSARNGIEVSTRAKEKFMRNTQAKAWRTSETLTLLWTEKMKKRLIEKALEETGGNKTKAARILGISRKTLFNKIAQYKIS